MEQEIIFQHLNPVDQEVQVEEVEDKVLEKLEEQEILRQ
jgi:hypothetical protein